MYYLALISSQISSNFSQLLLELGQNTWHLEGHSVNNKCTSLSVYWTKKWEIQTAFMYPDKLFRSYYIPIYENEVSTRTQHHIRLRTVIKPSMPPSVHCTDIQFFTRCQFRCTVEPTMQLRCNRNYKPIRSGQQLEFKARVREGLIYPSRVFVYSTVLDDRGYSWNLYKNL